MVENVLAVGVHALFEQPLRDMHGVVRVGGARCLAVHVQAAVCAVNQPETGVLGVQAPMLDEVEGAFDPGKVTDHLIIDA
ncbi:hypothetical protein D9M73_291770 [compost metagenome]